MTLKLVKRKINKIDYDYNLIYDKIEKIMKDNEIIDLGQKKINIFGLFTISLDFIPDIIERKTVISIVIAILEDLKFLEISNKNIRLKLELKPVKNCNIKKNDKTRLDNKLLLKFLKDFYDDNIEKKNLENFEFDDKIFSYVALLMISIIEDSSIIIFGHQLSLECIQLEEGLVESSGNNILIDKILKSLKKV